MEVRKRRLTLGRMMAVIGLVALGFAMTRVDAAPAVSLCVFAACTWYLANRRYAEALAKRSAEGVAVSPSRKVRIAVRCGLIAAIAIGLPDAAFLGGYYGYMEVIRATVIRTHWSPDLEPEHILMGALVGIAAALYVAAIMRRGFRPAAGKKRALPAATEPASLRWLLKHDRIAARRVPAC